MKRHGYRQFGEDVLSKLYSAVLMDVLDAMGFRLQCMDPSIRPLTPTMRAWGEAVTMYCEEATKVPTEPYQIELEVVDALQPGQIIVAQANTRQPCALWGGLLTNAAMGREGAGVITDCPSRDYAEIVSLGFPIFCPGLSPYDSLGRLDGKERNVPILIGGVRVRPGDLIFADVDGVVVVPQQAAPEAIERAWQKVQGENTVREELRAGASIAATFKKYGIL